MFNLTNILDSLDNAAKDIKEEDGEGGGAPSATWIRSQQRLSKSSSSGRMEADGEDSALKKETIKRDLSKELSAMRENDGGGTEGVGIDLASRVDHSKLDISTPFVGPNKMAPTTHRPPVPEFEDSDKAVGGGSGEDGAGVSSAPTSAQVPAALRSKPETSTREPVHSKVVEGLEREIERLNGECLELEEQVGSLKAEGQEAWTSYQRAQEKAAAIESELQEEVRSLNKAWTQDKQQFLAQAAQLREDCETSIKNMHEAQAERDTAVGKLEALKASAQNREATAAAREQELLTELAVARAGSAQGSQGLKDELRVAVEAAEKLRGDYAALQRHAQTRQTQLESTTAELTRELGNKERELQTLRQTGTRAGGEGEGAAGEKVEALQQDNRQLLDSVATEQDKVMKLEARLANVERDYHQATVTYEDERASLKQELLTVNRKLNAVSDQADRTRELEAALAEMESKSDGVTAAANLEQVQGLSKQLLKKQQMVLELQAERAALKSRAQDLQTQAEVAQRLLAEAGAGYEADPYETSVESGLYYRSEGLTNRNSSSRSSVELTRASAEMEKYGMKAPKPVASAVNAIDSWTLVTGRYLRSSPLVRVGITVYLVVLHLWVFFVLALHTNTLEDGGGGLAAADPKEFVNNKVPEKVMRIV